MLASFINWAESLKLRTGLRYSLVSERVVKPQISDCRGLLRWSLWRRDSTCPLWIPDGRKENQGLCRFDSAVTQRNVGSILRSFSAVARRKRPRPGWPAMNFQWFNELVISSVLSCLLTPVFYRRHLQTSFSVGDISTMTQLAVMLQMILSTKKKITELEMMVSRCCGWNSINRGHFQLPE